MSDRVRVHVVVKGRVQGVGFRYTTVDQARRLGVFGWVRNAQDGTVEAEAEGERAAVEALVRFLHRGPPGAFVEDVAILWEAHVGDLGPFQARH
ncbi:MAG TPA: acylphosphatase [Anaeromyxobacter sp.]|nr:acylphosphatase [Anaeromyxobacter sp.]